MNSVAEAKEEALEKAKFKSRVKSKSKWRAKLQEKAKPNKRSRGGAAYATLGLKLKPTRIPLVCGVVGCSTHTTNRRQQLCQAHKKQIRTEQLRINNVKWKKRVAAKKAGHHVVYRNKPTQWAAQHKDEAMRVVKAGHSIVNEDRLNEVLLKTPT